MPFPFRKPVNTEDSPDSSDSSSWSPPDYFKASSDSSSNDSKEESDKKWNPPDYFKTSSSSEEEKPGILSKAWNWASEPLTDAPSRLAKKVSEYIDPERGTKGARSALSAFVEGVGNAVSGLTSPVNLAFAGLGEGASAAEKLASPAIASALRTGSRVLSAPVTAEGARNVYRGIKDVNLPETLSGALEAGLGAAGMRSPGVAETGEPAISERPKGFIARSAEAPAYESERLYNEAIKEGFSDSAARKAAGLPIDKTAEIATTADESPIKQPVKSSFVNPFEKQALTEEKPLPIRSPNLAAEHFLPSEETQFSKPTTKSPEDIAYDIAREKFNMGRPLPEASEDLAIKEGEILPEISKTEQIGRIQRMLGVNKISDASLKDLEDVYSITKNSISDAERKASTVIKSFIDAKKGIKSNESWQPPDYFKPAEEPTEKGDLFSEATKEQGPAKAGLPYTDEGKVIGYTTDKEGSTGFQPASDIVSDLVPGFGGSGHPESPDYVNKVLKSAGVDESKPGLSVEQKGSAQHVVYRGKDGEPIAAAKIVQDTNGKNMVMDLAANKSKGLLTGRAMKAIGDKLEELKATEPAGTISADAQNFLDRMKGRTSLETKEPTWQPPDYFKSSEPQAAQTEIGNVSKRISRLVDDSGTIQLGFHDPVNEEQIKSMFPNQKISISKIKGDPLFGKVRKNNEFYRVNFWTKNDNLDWNASKKAVNDLGGHMYEARPSEPQATIEHPLLRETETGDLVPGTPESLHPQLVALRNYGDGVLHLDFDKSSEANQITADDIKTLLSERGYKNVDVTEMYTNKDLPSRFRVDVHGENPINSAELGDKIEKSVGGAFDKTSEPHESLLTDETGAAKIGRSKKVIEQPIKGPYGAALDKLFNSMGNILENRIQQDIINKQERAKRFAAFSGVKEGGVAGAAKSLSALKGEFEKVDIEKLMMKPKEADTLFTAVKKAKITEGEKARGYTALFKILNGDALPQRNELKVLDDVFGNGFSDRIIQMHGGISAAGLKISKLANTMKSLQNSISLAAPLRHGIGLAYRREFYPAFADMFKFFANKEYYNSAMQAIENKPNYLLKKEAGLFISKPGTLLNTEEGFLNSYAGKIPIARNLVGASQRAYVGFLNKLRDDVSENMLKTSKALGNEISTTVSNQQIPTKETKAIMRFINVFTGRGDLPGGLNKVTNELNTLLWSPRMMASRIQMFTNPKIYTDLPKGMRLEGLKSLLAIASLGTVIDSLAAVNGAKISNNILSTDFMKSRFGQHVIDPWGGLQQYVVAAARFLAGKTDSNSTGIQPSRLDIAGRFLANKESPAARFAHSLLTARKFDPTRTPGDIFGSGGYTDEYGQKTSIPTEVMRTFTPIFIQDLEDLSQSEPDFTKNIGLDTALGAASLAGMSQSYPEHKTGKIQLRKMRLRP